MISSPSSSDPSFSGFSFTVTGRDRHSQARTGLLQTPHGPLATPNFWFCATKASLKGLSSADLLSAQTPSLLANTYHLMLQPGAERIADLGGLHTFMGWPRPILTDSGGFQIFSLGHGSVADEIKGRRGGKNSVQAMDSSNRVSKKCPSTRLLRKITEDGATFQAYTDGRLHTLTPERAMEVQRLLGADFVVVLDECTPFHVEKSYTRASMERSHRWALRSLDAFTRHATGRQALYGIIQGGIYPDLREESGAFVRNNPFFGQAIGGSLGASRAQMYQVMETAASVCHPDRPTHLLGIGGIKDIFQGVRLGIDTFDCVHPTRLARHGGALVPPAILKEEVSLLHASETASSLGLLGRQHLNLRQARFCSDQRPIDSDCPCSTCTTYSRAYLHHLLKAREILALTALSLHNVTFMNRLMAAIRKGIANGNLDQVEKAWSQKETLV